ncbi:MAG: hypothetical protein K2Y02_12360, partial [Burkholderiaceae bacterium]|nr:hypothetical protein [Burkholderiaceae bacterium]
MSTELRSRSELTPRRTRPDAARHATTLAPALSGERITFDGLSCYVAGNGPPMLLVHSVNAACSAAEMRPLFDRYRATRTVFA